MEAANQPAIAVECDNKQDPKSGPCEALLVDSHVWDHEGDHDEVRPCTDFLTCDNGSRDLEHPARIQLEASQQMQACSPSALVQLPRETGLWEQLEEIFFNFEQEEAPCKPITEVGGTQWQYPEPAGPTDLPAVVGSSWSSQCFSNSADNSTARGLRTSSAPLLAGEIGGRLRQQQPPMSPPPVPVWQSRLRTQKRLRTFEQSLRQHEQKVHRHHKHPYAATREGEGGSEHAALPASCGKDVGRQQPRYGPFPCLPHDLGTTGTYHADDCSNMEDSLPGGSTASIAEPRLHWYGPPLKAGTIEEACDYQGTDYWGWTRHTPLSETQSQAQDDGQHADGSTALFLSPASSPLPPCHDNKPPSFSRPLPHHCYEAPGTSRPLHSVRESTPMILRAPPLGKHACIPSAPPMPTPGAQYQRRAASYCQATACPSRAVPTTCPSQLPPTACPCIVLPTAGPSTEQQPTAAPCVPEPARLCTSPSRSFGMQAAARLEVQAAVAGLEEHGTLGQRKSPPHHPQRAHSCQVPGLPRALVASTWPTTGLLSAASTSMLARLPKPTLPSCTLPCPADIPPAPIPTAQSLSLFQPRPQELAGPDQPPHHLRPCLGMKSELASGPAPHDIKAQATPTSSTPLRSTTPHADSAPLHLSPPLLLSSSANLTSPLAPITSHGKSIAGPDQGTGPRHPRSPWQQQDAVILDPQFALWTDPQTVMVGAALVRVGSDPQRAAPSAIRPATENSCKRLCPPAISHEYDAGEDPSANVPGDCIGLSTSSGCIDPMAMPGGCFDVSISTPGGGFYPSARSPGGPIGPSPRSQFSRQLRSGTQQQPHLHAGEACGHVLRDSNRKWEVRACVDQIATADAGQQRGVMDIAGDGSCSSALSGAEREEEPWAENSDSAVPADDPMGCASGMDAEVGWTQQIDKILKEASRRAGER